MSFMARVLAVIGGAIVAFALAADWIVGGSPGLGLYQLLLAGDYHYIRGTNNREERYRYGEDPSEGRNLATEGKAAHVLLRLRDLLARHLSTRGSLTPVGDTLR